MTQNLTGRAASKGISQGQWLNNEQAAAYLKEVSNAPHVVGRYHARLPDGLGQVILPGGKIVPADGVFLYPNAIGGFKDAYPIVLPSGCGLIPLKP